MEISILLVALALIGAFAYSFTVAATKPIPGSDTYSASKDGRILVTKGKKVTCLRAKASAEGMLVKLRSGTRTGVFTVHELVAEAHLPKPAGRTSVRHKDGNLRNNSVANLEWF